MSRRPEAGSPADRAPAVSVIVPTYNRAGTLMRALASIQAQTRQDHEIIVIDDGSTDATPHLLAEMAERGAIRMLRTACGGPAAARNQGLALARGRWIAFLDSDDIWMPDKLERQLPVLERGGVGVVHCDLLRVLPDGRTRIMRTPPIRCGGLLDRRGRDYQTKGLGIQSVVADAALLRAAGGFDERLRALEDLDLLLRLSQQGDFAAVHAPLVHYHAGPGVSSARLNVARARRRLLAKHRHRLASSRPALGYQCAKIALAYLRGGKPRAARRYARLALKLAPLSPAVAVPALLPMLGLPRILALLLSVERAMGAD
jgi:glycosyltransferase involved in cell wall biosynthesis